MLDSLKLKLKEVEIPPWVKWIAQDKSGLIAGFEEKPRVFGTAWIWEGDSRWEGLVMGDKVEEWQNTLLPYPFENNHEQK